MGEKMKKTLLSTICLSFLLTGCNSMLIQQQEPITNDQNQREPFQIETPPQENNEPIIEEPADQALTIDKNLLNETIEVNGKQQIVNVTNYVAMVNKEVGLPESYIPEDLVIPNVLFSFGNQDIEKAYIRQEAATALENLFNDAKVENISLFAVSGYRSYSRQKAIYQNEVAVSGEEWANKSVAVPGFSEHQTGLAMDVSAQSVGFTLTEDFGQTTEGIWLAQNAHKYGFIIRYPEGKEQITGYRYEPWHIRYVGVDVATDIYENNLTLEEYYNTVVAI